MEKFFSKKTPVIQAILIVLGLVVFNRLFPRVFGNATTFVSVISIIYGYFVYWLLKIRGEEKGRSITAGVITYFIGLTSFFIIIELIVFSILLFKKPAKS